MQSTTLTVMVWKVYPSNQIERGCSLRSCDAQRRARRSEGGWPYKELEFVTFATSRTSRLYGATPRVAGAMMTPELL